MYKGVRLSINKGDTLWLAARLNRLLENSKLFTEEQLVFLFPGSFLLVLIYFYREPLKGENLVEIFLSLQSQKHPLNLKCCFKPD